MRRPQGGLRQQRGVTLIEASVVLAVTAITVTSAAPGLQSFIEKQRLDGAAAQLANDIQFTRSEAVLRNTGLRLSVQAHAWGSCYILHSGAAGQCSCAESGPAQCNGDAQPLKTVQLRLADKIALTANVGSILFDPLFGTSSPTATFRLVAASGRTVQHVVNVMGRVRTCSPQGSVAGYVAC